MTDEFETTIRNVFGAKGEAWLHELPALIAECEQRWQIQVQAPFKLSYNYVAPAVRSDGTQCVLKLGVLSPDLSYEIEAMRVYAGRGICRLIDVDAERGAQLLERLLPGTMLSTLVPQQEEQATLIAAEVMRQLWRPAPAQHTLPTLAQWTAGLRSLRKEFAGGTGPFPAKLVAQAETLRQQLLSSSDDTTLLHGDLHHFNILRHGAGWLAIDPKGVMGERAYEIASFLYNPLDVEKITAQMLVRRVDQFSEILSLNRERIVGWGLVQAMLSAWWSYEGHEIGWEPMMGFAEMLAEMIGH